jgi:nucleoside-diphosphate-sugar epimerase
MKVLVTGAAGFIGAHVVRELQAAGHEAIAVVRPGSPTQRLAAVEGAFVVVELDLAIPSGLESVLADHAPDAIIHLAWYAEPGRYRNAVAENVASLGATAGVLLAAARHRVRRVVLGGTCVEAVEGPERPIYDAAKGAAHRLGEGFTDAGVSVACGHIFYLFGPDENVRRVVPAVIRSILAGRPIATTRGAETRDYLHVADVAAGLIALAAPSTPATGGVDICSGSLVTLADVLRIVGEETGRPDLIRFGELPEPLDRGYTEAGDPSALRALGWRPRLDLRAGIQDTIRWWTTQLEASR